MVSAQCFVLRRNLTYLDTAPTAPQVRNLLPIQTPTRASLSQILFEARSMLCRCQATTIGSGMEVCTFTCIHMTCFVGSQETLSLPRIRHRCDFAARLCAPLLLSWLLLASTSSSPCLAQTPSCCPLYGFAINTPARHEHIEPPDKLRMANSIYTNVLRTHKLCQPPISGAFCELAKCAIDMSTKPFAPPPSCIHLLSILVCEDCGLLFKRNASIA